MRTDFNFRRTLTTISFCAVNAPLMVLLAYIVHLLKHEAGPLERIAMGLILLLLVAIVGLAMTVALRQINARIAGVDIEASGGAAEEPTP